MNWAKITLKPVFIEPTEEHQISRYPVDRLMMMFAVEESVFFFFSQTWSINCIFMVRDWEAWMKSLWLRFSIRMCLVCLELILLVKLLWWTHDITYCYRHCHSCQSRWRCPCCSWLTVSPLHRPPPLVTAATTDRCSRHLRFLPHHRPLRCGLRCRGWAPWGLPPDSARAARRKRKWGTGEESRQRFDGWGEWGPDTRRWPCAPGWWWLSSSLFARSWGWRSREEFESWHQVKSWKVELTDWNTDSQIRGVLFLSFTSASANNVRGAQEEAQWWIRSVLFSLFLGETSTFSVLHWILQSGRALLQHN